MPDPNAPAQSVNPEQTSGSDDDDGFPLIAGGLRLRSASESLSPGLYLAAMPIGNAEDITLRALRILSVANVIACEDTRHSGRLLARYGIDTPLIPYHEHNAERTRPQLLARMASGEAVALISDAGMPLISDPGYKLVRDTVSKGIAVTCLPGASAATTGLVLSGLPTDRFLFAGFPPSRATARTRFLEGVSGIAATLVFFESPRRLAQSLAAMAETLGDREAAVARELTKRFEEVRRGPLSELAAHYEAAGPPKGEVVIVVGPRDGEADAATPEAVEAALATAFEDGLSLRDAVERVTAATGRPRRDVYASALDVRKSAATKGQPE